jgi:phosphate transport system substrate-binding protein
VGHSAIGETLMQRIAALALCAAIAGCGALPQMRSAKAPAGVIRVVGSSSTAIFARALATQYMQSRPGVDVRVVSTSSSAAPEGLLEDLSAIGMMSRPLHDKERDAIARKHGQPPQEVTVALDAVGIYVFKDNPLQSLSLEQAERIFGAAPRTGKRAQTWGDVGATGAWAARPILAFGFEPGRGAHEVFRELVLGGGAFQPRIQAEPVSTSVVQAVAMEPGGIGYASVYFRTARTRMLPLRGQRGEPVAPDEEAIAKGDYPLARPLYFYFNPGAPERTRAFLGFVQSEEGRHVVKANGGIPAAQ